MYSNLLQGRFPAELANGSPKDLSDCVDNAVVLNIPVCMNLEHL